MEFLNTCRAEAVSYIRSHAFSFISSKVCIYNFLNEIKAKASTHRSIIDCRGLKVHKYLLPLAFRSLINDLCVPVCLARRVRVRRHYLRVLADVFA